MIPANSPDTPPLWHCHLFVEMSSFVFPLVFLHVDTSLHYFLSSVSLFAVFSSSTVGYWVLLVDLRRVSVGQQAQQTLLVIRDCASSFSSRCPTLFLFFFFLLFLLVFLSPSTLYSALLLLALLVCKQHGWDMMFTTGSDRLRPSSRVMGQQTTLNFSINRRVTAYRGGK